MDYIVQTRISCSVYNTHVPVAGPSRVLTSTVTAPLLPAVRCTVKEPAGPPSAREREEGESWNNPEPPSSSKMVTRAEVAGGEASRGLVKESGEGGGREDFKLLYAIMNKLWTQIWLVE